MAMGHIVQSTLNQRQFCYAILYNTQSLQCLNRWQELSLINQSFLNHSQKQLRVRQRHIATCSLERLLGLGGFALLPSLYACFHKAFKSRSAELVGVSMWPFLLLSKEMLASLLLSLRASQHRAVPALNAGNVVKPVT